MRVSVRCARVRVRAAHVRVFSIYHFRTINPTSHHSLALEDEHRNNADRAILYLRESSKSGKHIYAIRRLANLKVLPTVLNEANFHAKLSKA